MWNQESWALESGMELEEYLISPKNGIWNLISTEAGIHGVESRIKDCPGSRAIAGRDIN